MTHDIAKLDNHSLYRRLGNKVKYFTERFKAVLLLCYVCLVFVMLLRLFIAALWSPAGKGLAFWLLFVMLNCVFVTFSCGILGQVWYLIASITDLCRLLYFDLFSWSSVIAVLPFVQIKDHQYWTSHQEEDNKSRMLQLHQPDYCQKETTHSKSKKESAIRGAQLVATGVPTMCLYN